MKKKYSFYLALSGAFAEFVVDLEKFTEEMARETLEFFVWDYDKEEPPIDAVMKKYALKAIEIATVEDYNAYGVISEFYDLEGFCELDGSTGIELVNVQRFDFEESDLAMKVTDINENDK